LFSLEALPGKRGKAPVQLIAAVNPEKEAKMGRLPRFV
jgi:hypothetical protein